jgi:hypothetical protein
MSLTIHRSSRALALSALLAALSACGSSSGTPSTPPGGGCTSDAQCASNQYCDFSGAPGRSTQPLLDPACFGPCMAERMCADFSCANDCAESCGATCTDFCNELCFDGAAVDSQCFADCVPDCEADRGSSPPPPPPPPPGDAGTPPSNPPQGVCRARETPPPPADGGTTEPPRPIDWTGTWSVRATYPVVCRWSSAGAPNEANLDFTVTARLTGSNSDLTADFSGQYTMTGTGNDSRLTLSGQFPGRDHRNQTATQVMRDNQVTVSIDEVVDANRARGRIEGNYETSGGISCVIQSGGTVELTR